MTSAGGSVERPALTLKGNPSAGTETFARICAACHSFRGLGHAVGPNLAALTDRSSNYLFTAILDLAELASSERAG